MKNGLDVDAGTSEETVTVTSFIDMHLSAILVVELLGIQATNRVANIAAAIVIHELIGALQINLYLVLRQYLLQYYDRQALERELVCK